VREDFFNMIEQRILMEIPSSKNDIVTILVFSFASFLGNFGVCVTGMGMALLFLFVYSIADFIGIMNDDECGEMIRKCDVKQAIFLQSVALTTTMPILLWKSRDDIKMYTNKKLLLAFIPATIIGTPIGNFLQDKIRSEIILIMVGVMITLFCCFQLLRLNKQRKEATALRRESSSGVAIIIEDVNNNNNPNVIENNNDDVGGDNNTPNVVENNDDVEQPSLNLNNNTIEIDDGTEENHQQTTTTSTEIINLNTTTNENSIISFWLLSFILGFIAGFLGGLNGVRSGPLLVFFIYYQFPKDSIRIHLMIVTAVNTYMRLAYYILIDNTVVWFEIDSIILYMSIISAGILAIYVGLYVSEQINIGAFNVIIVLGLFVAGVMNITKGIQDLINQ